MALSFRISRAGTTDGNPGGAGNYKLKTTSVKIALGGSPIAAVLPGVKPLLLDLGQHRVNITIEGIADFVGTDDSEGGVAFADKDDLEAFMDPEITNAWYNKVITFHDETVTGYFATYEIKISNIVLDKQDARGYWSFVIQAVGLKKTQATPP
jgi:hypothetical protein